MRRPLISLLAVLSTAALAPAAGAEPTATPVDGIAQAGEAIARGPGGTMWVAQPHAPGRITRIAADGTRTDFTGGVTPNLPANRKPSGVVALDDGSAWFLMDGGSEELGRITPAGTVIRYVLRPGTPTSLAAGPDGALWMTADGAGDDDDADRSAHRDAIVRYEPGAGATARFDDGLSADTNPRSLITGADGALWFTESGGEGQVGRMTTDGAVSWHPAAGQGPLTTLAPGPLESVWSARGDTVDPLGDVAIDPFSMSLDPVALAGGPDGALWGAGDGAVARALPGQPVTLHDAGLPANAKGQGLAAGPDGRMWMTLDRAPNLVRITVPPLVEPAEATATSVQAGVDPNGLDTTAFAELLGPDGTWQTVGETGAGAGTESTPMAFQLSGLSPGTDYRVRVRAVNDAGTATGAEASLRTADAPAPTPSPAPVKPPVMPAPAPGPAAIVYPVKGETLLAAATLGIVRVKTPGQTSFTPLDGIGSLPPGTVVDAARGRVLLASGHERTGLQFGLFAGGRFRMDQSKRGVGTVDLSLVGKLDCPRGKSHAVASRKRKKSRKIWGLDDGGSFKTHGRDSVTTVRGTLWLTEDTCRGTRVKVLDGAVSVRPKHGGRTRIVHAGHQLLTPRRR